MRRITVFTIVIIMILALSACGTNGASSEVENSDTSADTAVSETPSIDESEGSATVSEIVEESDESEPPPPEGTGVLTELTITASDNPTVAKDISFVIDEENRTATLTLDYENYVDLATLRNSHLTAVCDGGEAEFSWLTTDGGVNLTEDVVLIVVDDDGYNKEYELIVERTVYKLPIVNITLANGAKVSSIDRKETTQMIFSLDCTGIDGYESLGNISGTIRGRGNSTWKWEKKPYKIKLDEKAELLGLKDNRDWILLANYADKSLIRNTVAYEMGRVLDNLVWSPHSYPVDLFVNGEYRGVYALGEHLEVAKGRVDIEEGSSELDTDYLLEIGGSEKDSVKGVHYFHTDERLVRFATYKSPSYDEITDEQKAFLSDYFQKAEDAIIKGEGYEKYIDVDSFIDWIIIHELSYNIDSCYRRSCFLLKEKGGKIRMGPIWDFDFAFGNFSYDNKNYDDWATYGSNDTGAYVSYNWCTYLLKDKEFRARLAARWAEVRDKLLSVADDTIEKYGELLDAGSQQENYAVWDTWDERVGYQSKWCSAENTFEKQLQYLKNFIHKRADWITEKA